MNPANTFDFIQKNPEAAAILNKFKNGEFNDVESSKNAMNQLAAALGVKVKGAVGVGPSDPSGIGMDARSMPNVATGSQVKVVANNPYIPDSVGGTRSIKDWLPEAARITQKNGTIVVNATPRNPNVRSLLNLSDTELNKMGLKKVYQGDLLPEFKNMKFSETIGREIPSNKVSTIIFEKVK